MFSIDWEKITYANVTDTIRTIVPIFGVYIAYKSYTKYIKNKLLEKQLEQVIKIIEKIQQCKFIFSFHILEYQIKQQDIEKEIPKAMQWLEFIDNNIKNKVLKQESNLFDIALLSPNCMIFQNLKITDSANEQFKELRVFCNDPLVPKSIANQINRFLVSDEIFLSGKSKASFTSNNYVTIASPGHEGEINTPSDTSSFSSKETAFKSWRNFIISTKYLSKSIKNWMKNNGIKEINL